MARRKRDFGRANALWEELLGDSIDGLDAYEQLAIHYEHRTRQLERAASLTREALVHLQEAYRAGRIAPHTYRTRYARLQHRLARLTIKQQQVQGAKSKVHGPAFGPAF
jgi:hypothetical protein